MSTSIAAGEQPLQALLYLDRWYARATLAERGYILARIDQLLAVTPPERLEEEWSRLSFRQGPAAALLAYRLGDARDARGDVEGAHQIRREVASVRRDLGLSVRDEQPPAAVEPGLAAALLPSTGKQARVADLIAQALQLASAETQGAIDLHEVVSTDEVTVAMDAIARSRAVAALGPIDGAATDAAIARASSLRLPLLTLSPRPEERPASAWTFHIMHSAEQRARALARHAVKRGVKRFAMLAPESGYGRAVGAAFVDELTRAGGALVLTETYPAGTRSFAGVVARLTGTWEGIFVPEQADTLELIAPALAAGGLVPRPLPHGTLRNGRPVLLVSTAEGLAPDYVQDAGRHSEGALLAPGFYPDGSDPQIAEFSHRYQQAFGRVPGQAEAYAYDAARLVLALNSSSRDAAASAIAGASSVGVTGTVQFGVDHRRSDEGVVFTVVNTGGVIEIRAQR
jgi:ABC-type branched-subunit amino acid transport system substrate-binding protein